MNCSKCGQHLQDEDKYCTECGAQVNNDEFIVHTQKQVRVPQVLKWFGGALVYTNAVWITIASFRSLIWVFDESFAAGLILVLTSLAFIIYGIPVMTAWAGGNWTVEWAEESHSHWELWGKMITGFVGTIVLPYVFLFIINLLLFAIVA